MILHRGYKYRCYPTAEQIAMLDDWQGKQRFLWNVANAQRIQAAQRCRMKNPQPTAIDQINELKGLRALYPWLADVSQMAQAQLLVFLDLSWQRHYGGKTGRPEFKRKGRDRAPVAVAKDYALEGTGRKRHVKFPKLGLLEIVYHRPHKGVMRTCAITQDGDAYYVSFSCEVEVKTPVPSTKPPVGCDRGVKNTIALSTGYILPNPKHAEASEKQLKRAQRKAAKKQKGSNNQKKAYAEVGRIYRTVKRQRNHVLHVESKRLATLESSRVACYCMPWRWVVRSRTWLASDLIGWSSRNEPCRSVAELGG